MAREGGTIQDRADSDLDRKRIMALMENEKELRKLPGAENLLRIEDNLKTALVDFFSNPVLRRKYPFLDDFGSEMDIKQLHKVIVTFLVRADKEGVVNLDEFNLGSFIGNTYQGTIHSDLKMAYEHHVSSYERMFGELDKRREKNPNLTEVYLGRDAVYMYQARIMQLKARGCSSKDLAKIRYLNFPSVFISQNATEKLFNMREYVEGVLSGVKTDDIVFVDTGFAGSVPTHILQDILPEVELRRGMITPIKLLRYILQIVRADFDKKYLDSHILLLSSANKKRMAGGYIHIDNPSLAYNARYDVSVIENAPKPERTARGLYLDEGSGKVRTIPNYSSAPERLRYDLLRHLIMRHFYLEGKSQKN